MARKKPIVLEKLASTDAPRLKSMIDELCGLGGSANGHREAPNQWGKRFAASGKTYAPVIRPQ